MFQCSTYHWECLCNLNVITIKMPAQVHTNQKIATAQVARTP